MKYLLFAAVILFSATPVFGAYVGDPFAMPNEHKLGISVADDYVLDRNLDPNADAEVESSNAIYTRIGFGLTEYIELFTKLGAADYEQRWKSGGNTIDENYDYGFYSGLGIKGAYDFSVPWRIGFDIQYNRFDADVSDIKHAGTAAINETGNVDVEELQATLLVGYEMEPKFAGLMIPYAGVTVVDFEARDEGVTYTAGGTSYSTTGALQEDKNVGLLLGLTWKSIYENFMLTLEGRFFTEIAITLSGGYRF